MQSCSAYRQSYHFDNCQKSVRIQYFQRNSSNVNIFFRITNLMLIYFTKKFKLNLLLEEASLKNIFHYSQQNQKTK